MMIIYPAIDLRGGKVVRLREGDPNQQTIFSEQPLETAQRWIADRGTMDSCGQS
jgi:phosphoribosylformimino-5-aminoimidazole carboxamide ribotide isomerase